MNNNVFNAEEAFNVDVLKPNRSWTSVVGAGLELSGGLHLNIEGYFKYLFDRMYTPMYAGLENVEIQPQFNGTGRVWGIDLLLQKKQSGFVDGWISYSFNWTKLRDPNANGADMGFASGIDGYDSDPFANEYFPAHHRFHNLNLVLNVKPIPRINIYTRFGIASGVQITKLEGDEPVSYPVYIYDSDNPANSQLIEKYYWPSVSGETKRAKPTFILDIKFSFFGKANKILRSEFYIAVENVLFFVNVSQGNPGFNQYTGELTDTGSLSFSSLAFPIPSLGFKLSF
jgi:hypothetical protein